jgi:hypothetical protein
MSEGARYDKYDDGDWFFHFRLVGWWFVLGGGESGADIVRFAFHTSRTRPSALVVGFAPAGMFTSVGLVSLLNGSSLVPWLLRRLGLRYFLDTGSRQARVRAGTVGTERKETYRWKLFHRE